jgi:hypothetical protein
MSHLPLKRLYVLSSLSLDPWSNWHVNETSRFSDVRDTFWSLYIQRPLHSEFLFHFWDV